VLNLVLGRSGYGKTEYVFRRINELAGKTEKNILLFTPEQYSFAAERKLLTMLGEERVNCVDNLSFARISDIVSSTYGKDGVKMLSRGAKTILMTQAIDKSRDTLRLFNKKLDSLSFVESMISVYDEMKSCNLTSDEISERANTIDNEILQRKLFDISVIMNEYERLLGDKYTDASNLLTNVYNRLEDSDFFEGRDIFLDGYNGFVAQEYKLMELMVAKANSVTVTLCAEDCENEDDFSLFSYVKKTANIIRKMADKAGVPVNIEYLTENRRTDNATLYAIEKFAFSPSVSTCEYDGSAEIYIAGSISDECDNTARKIKTLLRKGYKASDITVITRSLEKYKDELSYSFKKYEVPFYDDERQPIKSQPLIVMIEYMLRCVNLSFRSDDVLSLAKTGLIDITDDEINALENYVYLWSIDGTKWLKPFENPIKAFDDNITEADEKALEAINMTRERIINPLLSLRKAAKTKNGADICESIYNILMAYSADKMLTEHAKELAALNLHILAQEQGRVWELTMQLLSQMAEIISDDIDLKTFAKLFSLMIMSEDLGSVPSGIDNVQFGQADRIRTDNPKAVFIIGALENEFPASVTDSGLLSEAERRLMLDADFKLYSYGTILNYQERYFAYMAMAAPSKYLHVSYIFDGSSSAPSEIVTELETILPGIKKYQKSDIEPIDLIESTQSAFNLMSEKFHDKASFYASLRRYFADDSRYEGISSLANNTNHRIKDSSISTKLYGRDIYISVSKIEDYYSCPFKYFCKFGLRAFPRTRAEINPMQRGTIVHYVLEMIVSEVGTKKLSTMTDGEIKELTDKYINKYFEEKMSAISDISEKFKYNYLRLSNLINQVVLRLSREFSNSDFEAKAFELPIDKDGEVKSLPLTLEDNGTIQIRGSIDRVDTYELNGEKYVRVVDYKTGTKNFCLSDILDGLNLQMFIYLFTLCSDKNAKLTGTPAGVLYVHARDKTVSLKSRHNVDEDVTKKKKDECLMEGIVLQDEEGKIPEAMEHNLTNKYIPVSVDSKGSVKGSLASLEELGMMQKKINDLIVRMGNELHSGNISQTPAYSKSHENTCEYCDYRDVCANRVMIEPKVCEPLSEKQTISELHKEYGENE
jgi:ATP-dependent helicase/nuclease subunit B